MKPWPQHQRRHLLSLVKEGQPVKPAAAAAGVPASTAYNWVRDEIGLLKPERAYRRHALPFRKWPEPYQERGRELSSIARSSLGQILAIADGRPITKNIIQEYERTRSAQASTSVLSDNLHGIATALSVVLPGENWQFVRARARALANSVPKKAKASPGKKRGRERLLSVGFEDWPKVYQDRWEGASSVRYARKGDVVPVQSGPLAKMSSDTLEGWQRAFGMWLHFSDTSGAATIPALDAMQQYVWSCRGRNLTERSLSKYLQDLFEIVRVLEPSRDWSWLGAMVRQQHTLAHQTDKKKWSKRLIDPTEIFALGHYLTCQAMTEPRDRMRTAVKFRNGLILMLLSSAPLRLRNLQQIETGRHLLLGQGVCGELSFPSVGTKTKKPMCYPLWPEIRRAIDLYMERFRPVLECGGQDENALWLKGNGQGKISRRGLYKMIIETTRKYLGVAINPHFIRDLVASKLLEEKPDTPELASRMLQHASLKSLVEYTEHASTIGAARVLAEASQAVAQEAA